MSSQVKELSEAIVCKGISVRTTNNAEISFETAKLGRLWQKFYQNHVSHLDEGEDIYGVFHNYESEDLVGAFDVVASWKVESEPAAGQNSSESNKRSEESSKDSKDSNVLSPENILSAAHGSDVITVTIPAGKYLVFTEEGRMPNTVMNAWEKAWEYFHNSDCEHTRTYNVDFEHYIGGNLEYGQLDLYIGIE
ncbi:MAG: GyrI-like domain-containing protein [Psychrobacter sp.]|jgi:predicted transcriptional regulator YdeE|uniref:GyrI-like domain-containing protein n=1 Tax=Psychrobacter sp. Ps3 TaxID=2790957 RepID=UPI00191B5B21|nr:GyrI-like domain-containing protein [Psychrobacter sp. Ps3]MCG3881498.1 GyrI-like domain-containing protein [Psychrobacter sp. Ps3]